jgi:hypothetical protein
MSLLLFLRFCQRPRCVCGVVVKSGCVLGCPRYIASTIHIHYIHSTQSIRCTTQHSLHTVNIVHTHHNTHYTTTLTLLHHYTTLNYTILHYYITILHYTSHLHPTIHFTTPYLLRLCVVKSTMAIPRFASCPSKSKLNVCVGSFVCVAPLDRRLLECM